MTESWAQAPFSPYAWTPVQVRTHEKSYEDARQFIGTYIDSLSVDFTFDGAEQFPLELATGVVAPAGSPGPCCSHIGENLIVCKGVVLGKASREPDDSGSCRNLRIAKLPDGLRPDSTLQFAALMREASLISNTNLVSCRAHLVTLAVTPDGWIHALSSHDAGLSREQSMCAIDLSAVRFCTKGGISLVDDVRLLHCEVAGTRLVVLQGMLSLKKFNRDNKGPLALLPESCRPPHQLHFVTAGARTGGFHLVSMNPTDAYGVGCGVTLLWQDCIWSMDQLSLSGIIYEVTPEALEHSMFDFCWSWESSRIFIKEFQGLLTRRYGSIERAWHEVFDTNEDGSINFTEFGLGCKAAGYVGNVMKLWAALDDDFSGDISLDELGQECQLAGVSSVMPEATPPSRSNALTPNRSCAPTPSRSCAPTPVVMASKLQSPKSQ